MERELWLALYEFVAKSKVKGRGWRYRTSDILLVYFWAALNDRPMYWATDPDNWPENLFHRHLPSQSQLSRRMKGEDVIEMMVEIEHMFVAKVGADKRLFRIIDGKPMDVSNVSKDKEAGYGRSAGGKHKGYKLHMVWSHSAVPLAWGIAPMNVSEKTMAQALIPTLPGGGYLLADAEYDANKLYDLAHDNDHQLIAPKRGRGKGLGHRRQSPFRLRSIELTKTNFGKQLLAYRRQIERDFGSMVSFGGGLTCLPAWVRTLRRVRNWVHAKILINAARCLLANQEYAMQAVA